MVANFNMLALDVGERRVGVATANSVARLSRPLKTILQTDHILDDINQIIEDEKINLIVIGLPRNLSGVDTAQTNYVKGFSAKLQKFVDIPIYFEDETFSSVRAKSTLDKAKKTYSKGDIDRLAACYILDDFIINNPEVING